MEKLFEIFGIIFKDYNFYIRIISCKYACDGFDNNDDNDDNSNNYDKPHGKNNNDIEVRSLI